VVVVTMYFSSVVLRALYLLDNFSASTLSARVCVCVMAGVEAKKSAAETTNYVLV
jgi:hypothetical protein